MTIIVTCLLSINLKASVPDAHSDELLKNPNMTSYPQIILNIMKYVPRWQASSEFTEGCKQSLSEKVLKPDLCLVEKPLNFFNSFRSKLFFDFDAEGKFAFEKVDFSMNKGLTVRGLLGLHKNQIRPLVIFRMGLHGNRDEFMSERFLIKILYEDLGYHVLMLESLTSHGFLMSNEQVAFGGLEEGLHTFYILNQIRNKEFSWVSQVSKIHLVALSMGGAGAFLTTYLDEQSHHQISSTLAFCPLLNLEKNFARILTPSWKNVFADLWNDHRMRIIKNKIPQVANINMWPMLWDQQPRFVPTLLKTIEVSQRQPLLKIADFKLHFPDIQFPENFKQHLENSSTFLASNNFWPVFKNEKTPIEIITTPNDQLVFNDLNTELFRTGQQPGIYKQTHFLELKGFHCSLAEEYQWPFLIEVVRRGLELN